MPLVRQPVRCSDGERATGGGLQSAGCTAASSGIIRC